MSVGTLPTLGTRHYTLAAQVLGHSLQGKVRRLVVYLGQEVVLEFHMVFTHRQTHEVVTFSVACRNAVWGFASTGALACKISMRTTAGQVGTEATRDKSANEDKGGKGVGRLQHERWRPGVGNEGGKQAFLPLY